MMTPLRFEQTYQAEWAELESLLDALLGRRSATTETASAVSGTRVAALYRRACEHLALARARSYPAYVVDRLERITADGHQLIYHRREFGFGRVRDILAVDFPRAVRKQRSYVAVAAATFLLPTIVIALLVYWRPELILSVVSPETAASFEQMYSPNADSIGRTRTARTDWMMFGFYIRNNVGVAFQCFAGGLFAGLGALFFLAYNGSFAGALAGYLTERGLSSTFYSFVATHSAFEVTAIGPGWSGRIENRPRPAGATPADTAAIARAGDRGFGGCSLRRHGDAVRRRGHRSILVIRQLDCAGGQVRRRRRLLDRRRRLLLSARTPCRLTRSPSGYGRGRPSKRLTQGYGSASSPRAPCIPVTPSWHCQSWPLPWPPISSRTGCRAW